MDTKEILLKLRTEMGLSQDELAGHKWVDLSEGNYGVALLNDCKYGYDVQGNVIGLSLIKSAVDPDETADRGIHYFTYSLYPHKGTFIDSDVQKQALNLNMPVLTQTLTRSQTTADFASYSLVEVDDDHILIDTVKKSEDGQGLIVRLYEYKNKKEQKASIRLHVPVSRVYECSLCEEDEIEIPVQEGKICVDFGCYEIKTFKVYYEKD